MDKMGTGATGQNGQDGADGTNGIDGQDGATGPTGATGATGQNGQDGADGINGIDGQDGATGPTGATGATGQNGQDGADGINGIDGQDGATGPTGATGATGQNGQDGADGINGIDGQDGATGPTGATGATGQNGQDGADGINGIDGQGWPLATGPTGSVNTGATGATGLWIINGLSVNDILVWNDPDGNGINEWSPIFIIDEIESQWTLQQNIQGQDEYLYYTGDANVGIGINIASAKLEVAGDVKISSGQGNLTVEGTSTLKNNVLIENGGKLGINISSTPPAYDLQVNGSASSSPSMFVDSLTINPGNDGYSFPKTRPGSSYSAIPSDYRLKYDGNGKLEWVDVNALTAVVGDVIDSLDNLGDVYVDHPDFNAFIGSNPSNISGNRNTSVGISALKNVTSGANNTAVGRQTMLNNDEGSGNTALGSGALVKYTEGDQNIAVGLDALYLNNTGSDNIALGKLSGVNSQGPILSTKSN